MTRPGHPSREREVDAVREAFQTSPHLKRTKVVELQDASARVDGGDCLFTGRHLFVGISTRTNEQGARCLQQAFGASLPVITVDMATHGALHLKSLCSLLRPGLLCFHHSDAGLDVMAQMSDQVGSSTYKAVAVPDQLTANAVSIYGDSKWRGLLVQKGRCTESLGIIRDAFSVAERERVIEVDTSELAKQDGALTCCSLLCTV
ncbi:unnamed protein product [Chrysoparadoxa australica]